VAISEITMDAIVCRSTDLIASNVDGEVVMMSVGQGEYYGLNQIASKIWGLIESPVRVDEIIRLLLEEYNCNRSACERDVMEFLNHCREQKILRVNAGE